MNFDISFWSKFISVFICVAATDACWTFYIIKTAQKKHLLLVFGVH